ncbi:hypothetical protein [Wolbachia endosymbiont (group A) of Volucella inflata]|uniref:hypothetical protein n=1 Tax=Wolbachia endosymbiont (group A) of Volucella inflata TaxID=2954065 RepID=UPI002227B60E|nr:hypothetical protein [Wolbachia endosymbiont (group A) of Volucella inflata]
MVNHCKEYRNDFLEKESEELKSISGELEEYIREIGRLSAKDEDCFNENISQVETYIKSCNKQNNLQVNDPLKKAIGKSKSAFERLERNVIETEKFLAKPKEHEKKLKSFENEAKRSSVKLEKNMKINNSTALKDLSSQLSTAKVEKKSSENEVARFQDTAKSTTGSMKSKIPKAFSKLFGDKNLDNLLSKKNEELKKVFLNLKKSTFAITCLIKL